MSTEAPKRCGEKKNASDKARAGLREKGRFPTGPVHQTNKGRLPGPGKNGAGARLAGQQSVGMTAADSDTDQPPQIKTWKISNGFLDECRIVRWFNVSSTCIIRCWQSSADRREDARREDFNQVPRPRSIGAWHPDWKSFHSIAAGNGESHWLASHQAGKAPSLIGVSGGLRWPTFCNPSHRGQ
jgi:hypothetical protein